MWDLWWTKWHWGFFSEYFGFPCQSSFHQLLHNHQHRSSGAGTIGQQWPTYQVDSVSPHLEKLKKKLVAGFPPWRPGFDLRSGHVRLVVDLVFSEYFRSPSQFLLHQLIHIYLPFYNPTLYSLDTESVVKQPT
jgi:hypothetical protein